MKNMLIKTIFIICILILLFSINTKSYALGQVIEDGDSFLGAADGTDAQISMPKLQELSGYLYNILLSAGVIIAVIIATILGIQFMMGGAEGQAKVKEMIVPFIVGCIVVFGGFGIWKVAMSLGQQVEDTESGSYSSTERRCIHCGKVLTEIEKEENWCDSCGMST